MFLLQSYMKLRGQGDMGRYKVTSQIAQYNQCREIGNLWEFVKPFLYIFNYYFLLRSEILRVI